MTLAELRTDVVILACAISAGIHGALAPEHFARGHRRRRRLRRRDRPAGRPRRRADRAGRRSPRSLATAAVLRRPDRELRARGHDRAARCSIPSPKPVDGLALFTKAVEAVGLARGARACCGGRRLALTLPQPKGTLT